MAELKTTQNEAPVAAFIDSIDHAKRQADARKVCEMIASVTGWKAKMWGKSIIGFGAYDSKNGGRWMMTGLSPRKASLSVYIMPGFSEFSDLMSKLGKHKTGKSCLYINKLEDIDLAVLEQLVVQSVDIMKARYPWAPE